MSSTCSICSTSIENPTDLYRCSREGAISKRGPHPDCHLSCISTWAITKRDANHPIHCFYPGCYTDISHLLPPPTLFKQASNFLLERSPFVILAAGIPLVGINSFEISIATILAIAATGKVTAGEACVGAAAAAVGAVGAMGGVALTTAAIAIAASAGGVAAAVAGLKAEAEERELRGIDFLKNGAATAAVVGISILRNRGSFLLSGGFACVSLLGTWLKARHLMRLWVVDEFE